MNSHMKKKEIIWFFWIFNHPIYSCTGLKRFQMSKNTAFKMCLSKGKFMFPFWMNFLNFISNLKNQPKKITWHRILTFCFPSKLLIKVPAFLRLSMLLYQDPTYLTVIKAKIKINYKSTCHIFPIICWTKFNCISWHYFFDMNNFLPISCMNGVLIMYIGKFCQLIDFLIC